MEILANFPDKNSAQMVDLKKKMNEAITLGETCKQKRDSNPECNFKHVYLQNFDSIGK